MRAVSSGLPERHPNLQSAEASGILHSEIEVVRGFVLEVIVRRVIGKGVQQLLWFPHEGATGFKRCIQPFVRIDRDGIGILQCRQVCRSSRCIRSKRAVGAIDVEPQSIIPAYGSKIRQRINCSCSYRSRVADYQKRQLSLIAIPCDLPAQSIRIHALLLVRFNPSDRIGSVAE